MAMRGLTLFISDIRNCVNKENERKRIDKEMAKIRKAFKDARSLSPYQKKKYVWKMLYMFVLGYEIDFGHMEALSLISGSTWSEKQVGYLACALLLNENHEFLRLIINSVKNDLLSHNEDIQCLALACIANVGGVEFAEALTGDVEKLFHSSNARSYVKKKSSLGLLRMYRKYPDICNPDNVRDRLLVLLDDRSVGVVTSAMSLVLGLVSVNPRGWDAAVPKCCKLVSKLAHPNAARELGQEYVYHHVCCPWLMVKLLRLLQYFPPPEDPDLMRRLCDVLSRIFTDTHTQKDVNKNNALHAELFECINLAIHIETDTDLLSQAMTVLGRFIQAREANYRYLALDAMQRIVGLPDMNEQFKRHQATIISALKDKDISIRRRALDLLYGMCDHSNSEEIVNELLDYLTGTDFSIREELVLRVAILAEKFATTLEWYVDVILRLISLAGDHVSDDIWFRVVQIITNKEELQRYAAETVYKALQHEPVHETMVRIGGYVLGEFGHHIDEDASSTPLQQFTTLHAKYHTATPTTKALLLTSYIKFVNLYPDLRVQVSAVFESYQTTIDTELQQRAVEYLSLAGVNTEVVTTVLDMMPAYPEGRQSLLLKRMKEHEASKVRAVRKEEEEEEDDEAPKMVELDVSAATAKADRPARAPAPSSGGASGDLLGGLDDGPAPAPAPAAAPLDDLLGGDLLGGGLSLGGGLGGGAAMPTGGGLLDLMGGGGSTSSDNPPDNPEIAKPEEVKELFKNFSLRNDGLLYQDGFLTVQVQAQYQLSMGRITLSFQNRQNVALDGFRTHMQPVPYLRFQLSQLQQQLAPRGTLQQTIQMEILEPFLESPSFKVSFTYDEEHRVALASHLASFHGKTINQTFKLPIHICKFMQGVQCDASQFFATWKNSARPVNLPEVTNLMGAGLNFAVLPGVEPNAANLVAAGKVMCLSAGELYALVRVESNTQKQAYRLTIRTPSGPATASIKNLIMAQLAAPQ